MKEDEIRKSVIEAGHRLLEKGLTARTWGNISARIDEDTMIITPSGRDYLDMEACELVKVNISDLSYSGSIKPSVEKNFHAGIYKLHPEAEFIIHTHQLYASAASTIGKDEIAVDNKKFPLLGHSIITAGYGIPGSKKLSRNVLQAVEESNGSAVLMKAHGAVCFGRNMEEAFSTSVQLEAAVKQVIEDRYKLLSGRESKNLYEITSYALSRFYKSEEKKMNEGNNTDYSSERKKDGIRFWKMGTGRILTDKDGRYKEIHTAVYDKYQNVNSIVFSNTPAIKAVAAYGVDLKPLLDDFAQMDGTIVRTVPMDKDKILWALKKSSAVIIKDEGALCIGGTKEDAEAAAIILNKACICLAAAALFDKVSYLNPIESFAMRKVYLNKYSKKKNKS